MRCRIRARAFELRLYGTTCESRSQTSSSLACTFAGILHRIAFRNGPAQSGRCPVQVEQIDDSTCCEAIEVVVDEHHVSRNQSRLPVSARVWFILFNVRRTGDIFGYLQIKAAILGMIFLPLFIFSKVNGMAAYVAVRTRLLVVAVIVAVNLSFDLIAFSGSILK